MQRGALSAAGPRRSLRVSAGMSVPKEECDGGLTGELSDPAL